jgi:hypothetical protein
VKRYFVAFGQFFYAKNKAEAQDEAAFALWSGERNFGISVEERPEVEVDTSTGLKHWHGENA